VDPVPGYGAIQAKPFENRHLLSKVGDFYARLKDSYDEKFYQQEVLGNYLSMQGGRVYGAFDRTSHVKELVVNPSLPLHWALDFNVDPMSSVIVQIAGGEIRVVGEIVIRRATTGQACEEFLKRFPAHTMGVVIHGDASGNAMQTTGATDYQMIREYFAVHSRTPVRYKVPRSNPGVRDRCNLMNRQLRSAAGDIGLLVDPRCKEVILDLEQVSYKQETNIIDKDRDRQRTHLSDALGYLVWQECRQEPGTMNGTRRLPGL
jgi:hypothetical protein